MKYLLLAFSFLVLVACSKAPACLYSGNNNSGSSTEEANAGCLVIYDKKVLMVEGHSGLLSLPGGGKRSGESPQCTAEREVWEETGIEVKANQRIATFDNGFQLFSCEIAEGQVFDGSARPFRWEIAEVHWIGKGQFVGRNWRFPEQVALIERYISME